MKKSKATEALRLAPEIAAIRAALNKHGYHLRKRSKQADWTILAPLSPPKTQLSPYSPFVPPLARGARGVKAIGETQETYLQGRSPRRENTP